MSYDKMQVKESLEPEDVFDILDSLSAEPQMHDNYIISKTICHNPDDIENASHKLYYYFSNKLFYCYSGCSPASFDIFELLQKVKHLDLNEAIYYVVNFFNLGWKLEETDETYLQEDWKVMQKWQELSAIKINYDKVVLPEIDGSVLRHYPKPHILDWERQFIPKEVSDYMGIRYDPTIGAVIIPHLDENGRLVGIRQRTLVSEDAEKYGKYRPWRHEGLSTNHPLSFNLYGLYQSKENIKKMGVAIVAESEKSTLQLLHYLGSSSNIAVSVCGSSISKYQFNLLLDAGAKEICIAFDADFEEIGDENWERTVEKLQKIYDKYNAYANISFLFDTKGTLLGYKDSPTDRGKEVFMELWKNRVFL